MPDEVTDLGASELARRIASGTLSARAVLDEHIRRVEATDERLNALVIKCFDAARRKADAIDAKRAGGEPLGPLVGVPITIKESFDVEGTPTTMGLSARTAHRAPSDGPLVARLRAAGALIIGKTNVPQLVMLNETDNPVYGRTNNPWNTVRATGGSSGGCAAVVSAGGSALSLGSDIGGSIRCPAHACGVHGLKPTAGRLTMFGHATIFDGQEAVEAQPGPLARRIADLRVAMRVLAAPGQENFDPAIAPVGAGAFEESTGVAGLRVAMYTDNGIMRPSPAIRRAVEEAARALQERGAEVAEWMPPAAHEAWDTYQGLLFADGMRWARRALRGSLRDWRVRLIVNSLGLPRFMHRLGSCEMALIGQSHLAGYMRRLGRRSVGAYWQLIEQRARYRLRFTAALDAGRFDAIICPPDALPALTHGSSIYLSDALSYGALYNFLGMPAGVVAATRVRPGEESDRPRTRDVVERVALRVEGESAGLPVGVQVVARHWREDVALDVMAALEEHFRATADYPSMPTV